MTTTTTSTRPKIIHHLMFGILWTLVLCVPNLAFADGFKLKNGLGLYVTPKGQEVLSRSIPQMMAFNGLSTNEFYIHEQTITSDEGDVDDFFNRDQGPMASMLKSIKDNFQRFFIGPDFKPHKFETHLKNLDIVIDWDLFDIKFYEIPSTELKPREGVRAMISLRAESFNMKLKSLVTKDLNNEILGPFGITNFEMSNEVGSTSLELGMVVDFISDPDDGPLKIDIREVRTNANLLKINTSWDTPLITPDVSININGNDYKLSWKELEGLLIEKQEELKSQILGFVSDWTATDGKVELNKLISEYTKEGFQEINQMDPPGAPDATATKYIWDFSLAKMNFVNDLLHLGLDGYVLDPTQPDNDVTIPDDQITTLMPDVRNQVDFSNDMILGINQGFFNKVMLLSFNRGYFTEMPLESGESIRISRPPVLDLTAERPVLNIEIRYSVTGFQAIFVKNPIRLRVDLFVDFPLVEKRFSQMIVTGVDFNSIELPRRFIRMFPGKVRKAVRKTLRDMSGDLQGIVLAEELPVPLSIGGLPVAPQSISIDKNGYLLFYMDFNLPNGEEEL
jgi:hypothetical protein